MTAKYRLYVTRITISLAGATPTNHQVIDNTRQDHAETCMQANQRRGGGGHTRALAAAVAVDALPW